MSSTKKDNHHIEIAKLKKKLRKTVPLKNSRKVLKFFKKSKGKIICLMDSDDFYHKDKITKVYDCFEKNKSYDFIQNLPIIIKNNDGAAAASNKSCEAKT